MKTRILALIILLFGISLHAQDSDRYLPDTVWLKSGEVIPCKISSIDSHNNLITIQAYDTNNTLVYKPMSFNLVKTYIIGPEVQPKGKQPSQYKIDLLDGTRLTGTIISENDSVLVLKLHDLGELKIRKDKIDKMIPLNAPPELWKSFWFKNPNATRLLFAPTAIPLKKGEGYYQNIYIVGNMFNYGVMDNFSIGGGFDFITMFTRNGGDWNPLLNFNAKTGVKVHDNVHIGAGGLYITQLNDFSAGIAYALGTFGSYNSNFTSGLGWGFVDGTFEKKPFIMLGGMVRCSEKVWFISENWIAPVDGDQYYFVVSYGVRFSGKKMCVDLAFINSKDIFEGIVIGIPYVDFVIKFGK
jgi:hypothetical protein